MVKLLEPVLHIRITPKIEGTPIQRLDRLIKFGDIISLVDIKGEMICTSDDDRLIPYSSTIQFDEIMCEIIAIGNDLPAVITDLALTPEYLTKVVNLTVEKL